MGNSPKKHRVAKTMLSAALSIAMVVSYTPVVAWGDSVSAGESTSSENLVNAADSITVSYNGVESKFSTLESALAALRTEVSESGAASTVSSTISLAADVSIQNTLKIDVPNVTIDGGGYAIDASPLKGQGAPAIEVASTGISLQSLTIKGGKPTDVSEDAAIKGSECCVMVDAASQANLTNVTATESVLGIIVKAKASDFASVDGSALNNASYTRLYQKIDVSNNAFGGIRLDCGDSETTLQILRGTKPNIINGTEAPGKPTVWGAQWKNIEGQTFYADIAGGKYYLSCSNLRPESEPVLTVGEAATYTSPTGSCCNIAVPYSFSVPNDARGYRLKVGGARVRTELYIKTAIGTYSYVGRYDSADEDAVIDCLERGKDYRIAVMPLDDAYGQDGNATASITLEAFETSGTTDDYKLTWSNGNFYDDAPATAGSFGVRCISTSEDASSLFDIQLTDIGGNPLEAASEVGNFKVIASPKDSENISGPALYGVFTVLDHKDIGNYRFETSGTIQVDAEHPASLSKLGIKMYRYGSRTPIDGDVFTLSKGDDAWYKAVATENGGYTRDESTASATAPTSAGEYFVKLQGAKGYKGTAHVQFTADDIYGNPNGISLDSRCKVENMRTTQMASWFRGGLIENGEITALEVIYANAEGSNTFGSSLVYGTDFEIYGYLPYTGSEENKYPRSPAVGEFEKNGAPTTPGRYWACLAAKPGSAYSGRTVVCMPLSTRTTNLFHATAELTGTAQMDGDTVTQLPTFNVYLGGELVSPANYDMVITDNWNGDITITEGSVIDRTHTYTATFKGKNGYEGATSYFNNAGFLFCPDVASDYQTSGEVGGCTYAIADGVLTISPKDGSAGVIDRRTWFKWPWQTGNDGSRYLIDTVRVEGNVTLIGNASDMFNGMSNLRTADLRGLTLNEVGNLSGVFADCPNLVSVTLGEGFNTTSVKNWSYMFSNCVSLSAKSINDWSKLNLANAVNVSRMFYNCKNLTTIPASLCFPSTVQQSNECFFVEDRAKVGLATTYAGEGNISDAFPGYDWDACNRIMAHATCEPVAVTLEREDGTTFVGYRCGVCGTYYADAACTQTLDGERFWRSFGGCRWIIKSDGCLVIEAVGSGEDAGQMPSLVRINSAPWYSQRADITSVVIGRGVKAGDSFGFAFAGCHHMTYADLTNLDGSRTSSFQYLFMDCNALARIDLPKSGLVTSTARNLHGVFFGCMSLEDIDISGFETTNVTEAHELFMDCGKLKSIKGLHSNGNGSTCNFRSLYWANNMFRNCVSLKSVTLRAEADANGGVRGITSAYLMFSGCRELKSVTFNGVDFSNIQSCDKIFYDCPSLEWVPEGLCLAPGATQCFWTEKKAAIKFKQSADASVRNYDFAADNRILDAKGIEDAELNYKKEVLASDSAVSMENLSITAEGAGIEIEDFTFGGWYEGSAHYDEQSGEWVRTQLSADEDDGPSAEGEYTILLIAEGSAGSEPAEQASTFSLRSLMRLMGATALSDESDNTCYGIVYLPFSVVSKLTPEEPGTGGDEGGSDNEGTGGGSTGGGTVTPPTPSDPVVPSEPTTPSEPEQPAQPEEPQQPEEPSEPAEPEQPEEPAPAPQPGDELTIDEGNAAGSIVTVTTPAGEDGKGGSVAFAGTSEAVKNLVVPSVVEIDGVSYKVTAIADNAFRGNTTLRSVTLPNTVTEIGENAFRNCENLRTVTLSSRSVKIGERAFSGCSKLVEVRTGKSAVTVGRAAFQGCTSLTTLILGRSVEKVGVDVVKGCSKLKTIRIYSGKLTKKGIRNLVKGTGAVTIKCYGAAKALKDTYTKWARQYNKKASVK